VTLRSGCRLVVAPLFHLPVEWGRRLFLETGVEGGWRSPDAYELTLLLPDASLPIPRASLTDDVCLFRLPQHLRAAWWRLLEQANERGTMSEDGFDAFAVAVGQFLAFKELPLPEGASLELLLSKPGQRAAVELSCERPLWGVINLGDEPASLVLVNLPGHEFRVRFLIEPGEGCRFPAVGLLVDGYTLDKCEPDVLLLVRRRREAGIKEEEQG
jgi:hypothetical protein